MKNFVIILIQSILADEMVVCMCDEWWMDGQYCVVGWGTKDGWTREKRKWGVWKVREEEEMKWVVMSQGWCEMLGLWNCGKRGLDKPMDKHTN